MSLKLVSPAVVEHVTGIFLFLTKIQIEQFLIKNLMEIHVKKLVVIQSLCPLSTLKVLSWTMLKSLQYFFSLFFFLFKKKRRNKRINKKNKICKNIKNDNKTRGHFN